jgi:cytochrome c oxidase subunit 4
MIFQGRSTRSSLNYRRGQSDLVILYFMHVRYSGKLVWLVIVAALLWLVIMFAITFSDYWTRGWQPPF